MSTEKVEDPMIAARLKYLSENGGPPEYPKVSFEFNSRTKGFMAIGIACVAATVAFTKFREHLNEGEDT